MNILLISQCHKNALKETRRILDQFAERRGERTWQTPITKQGLDTLRRLLRKSARKNSAIACHWIRGKDHSELLWVVGDASRFNAEGAVPTNTTTRNVLRQADENDWHSLDAITRLTAIAALWHDMGKANQFFQGKLLSSKRLADPLRHEWISLRLWQAFVGDDDDQGWLTRLAELPEVPDLGWMDRSIQDAKEGLEESPFDTLPPLASAVGWLMVSHHRLPTNTAEGRIAPHPGLLDVLPMDTLASWCGLSRKAEAEEFPRCWTFEHPLPLSSGSWQKRMRKAATRALQQPRLLQAQGLRDERYLLHHARLALMLADHHYSSLTKPIERQQGDDHYPLWANSCSDVAGKKRHNQPLDEHLIGVERSSSRVLHALPRLAHELPRLARHSGFRKRSADRRYRWQDQAFDLAEGLREASHQHGFFGINMASTGRGKTLANGRILYALANPVLGARFTIAIGLRTLTLQTGQVYRERLQLGADDLAVLVGGGAVRRLHEHQHAQQGSESLEALLPEGTQLHYEAALQPGPLSDWLGNSRGAHGLLDAPILCCTIDHLMPATESLRGGHQIAPMLRLMSSDLVLDEPDDFGLEDLPALCRLVHWAGLLGSRVLLSSATLPPALVEAMFSAYCEGRRHYQAHRGEPGLSLKLVTAWFDEFGCTSARHTELASFSAQHSDWVSGRIAHLAELASTPQRRAVIGPLSAEGPRETHPPRVAEQLHAYLHDLHRAHHTPDPHSSRRVSFGLVRIANIDPLVAITRALALLPAQPDCRIHLCCYHSHHPLLVRSAIEQRLDRLLNRHPPELLFHDPQLRATLNRYPEQEQIFIVLATAVAEVGRDHDYDWAIVEPSSMRSIIQLAGRVRRHRGPLAPDAPANLVLLQQNLRALRGATPAYTRPGFESDDFPLDHHRLDRLLTADQLARIDASSRIQQRAELEPTRNLADLEHHHLRAALLGSREMSITAANLWWQSRAHHSGEMQRHQPFRHDPRGRTRYTLEYDGEEERVSFARVENDGTQVCVDKEFSYQPLECAAGISLWGGGDYAQQILALAESLGEGPEGVAQRYGTLELPGWEDGQQWHYHPALGFSRG